MFNPAKSEQSEDVADATPQITDNNITNWMEFVKGM